MEDQILRYTLRVDRTLFQKFRYGKIHLDEEQKAGG